MKGCMYDWMMLCVLLRAPQLVIEGNTNSKRCACTPAEWCGGMACQVRRIADEALAPCWIDCNLSNLYCDLAGRPVSYFLSKAKLVLFTAQSCSGIL